MKMENDEFRMTNGESVNCGKSVFSDKLVVVAGENARGLAHSKTLRADRNQQGIRYPMGGDGAEIFAGRSRDFLKNTILRNKPKLKMRESPYFIVLKRGFLR
jgi:hypothetical protein